MKYLLVLGMLGMSQAANACVDFSGSYLIENPMYGFAVVTQDGCDSVFVSNQNAPEPKDESEGSYYPKKPYYSAGKGQFNDVGSFSISAFMDTYFVHTSQIMYSDENGVYAFNAITTYQKLKSGDIEERTVLTSTREETTKNRLPEIKIWKKLNSSKMP